MQKVCVIIIIDKHTTDCVIEWGVKQHKPREASARMSLALYCSRAINV